MNGARGLRALPAGRVTEEGNEPAGGHRPAGRRPELIGRGTAVGYTGAYREAGGLDIEEVVAVQTARGPE